MSSTDDPAAPENSWAQEGGRKARKVIDDAEEAVTETAHRVAHPLASLGIAFMLGFLTCMTFGRR